MKKIFLCIPFVLLLILCYSCKKESNEVPPFQRELRIWLHHVNTIEKAFFFRDLYDGYELDVHFDTNTGNFYVKHDAIEPSILTLEEWLSAIYRPDLMGYWLDFKNLDTHNAFASFQKLESLRSSFLLSRTIVVESSSPSSLAPYENGHYLTSYYIPTFDPSSLTPQEEIEYRDFIADRIKNTSITTISGYSSQLDFMQKWFLKLNKLVWYLDSTVPELKDSVINLVEKNQTVDILLVSESFSMDVSTEK